MAFEPSGNEKHPNVKSSETVVRKTYRNFLLSVLNCVTGPLSKYRYHFKLNYLIIKFVFLKNAIQRYTGVIRKYYNGLSKTYGVQSKSQDCFNRSKIF